MQVTTDDLFVLLLFFLFVLSFILLSVTHLTHYTILIYYYTIFLLVSHMLEQHRCKINEFH